MSAKIIALVNQKGGVGKTTTSVNLAAALAQAEKRVLLLDLDPQGNASMGAGVNKNALENTINEVFLGETDIDQAIIRNTPAGFDLLASNRDLTQAEVSLLRQGNQQSLLKSSLQAIRSRYDFVLIDCPPSLNMLTVNALVAANSLLIPMQCEYYALEGLSELLSTVKQIKSSLNPDLEIEGILRTMYDGRNRLSNEVSQQLRQHFKDKLYQCVIPRNVRLAEAPSHGLPVILYDRGSRGAQAYTALAQEFLARQQLTPAPVAAEVMEEPA